MRGWEHIPEEEVALEVGHKSVEVPTLLESKLLSFRGGCRDT